MIRTGFWGDSRESPEGSGFWRILRQNVRVLGEVSRCSWCLWHSLVKSWECLGAPQQVQRVSSRGFGEAAGGSSGRQERVLVLGTRRLPGLSGRHGGVGEDWASCTGGGDSHSTISWFFALSALEGTVDLSAALQSSLAGLRTRHVNLGDPFYVRC